VSAGGGGARLRRPPRWEIIIFPARARSLGAPSERASKLPPPASNGNMLMNGSSHSLSLSPAARKPTSQPAHRSLAGWLAGCRRGRGGGESRAPVALGAMRASARPIGESGQGRRKEAPANNGLRNKLARRLQLRATLRSLLLARNVTSGLELC